MLTEVEQAAVEAHFGSADLASGWSSDSAEHAIFLGLRLLLEAGRLVRDQRTTPDRDDVALKADGSPTTELEEAIELRLRDLLASIGSEAVVVGEETGGDLPEAGLAVAIDPIDGTWAFLTETETYSTTLALIRDRRTILGMVSNPVTGEIAYATSGQERSRLVRLGLFGESTAAHALPTRSTDVAVTLVNVHPNRAAGTVLDSLYRAWQDGEIAMVRSAGGSPAWALTEASRGHFVYVNLWSRRAAAAYDLAAGALIVRQAGGELIDLTGRPIDELHHAGPFVAGLDSGMTTRVAEWVRRGMESDSLSDQSGD
jgi:fructose-1,6-bisphosphatase/inositol monophosphatase family enzyme